TVGRSFIITKSWQLISFTQPADTPFSAGSLVLTATAPGGTVTFTSLSTGVCTVAGSTVTFVTPGECVIYANQAGDATYSPAPTVGRSFIITKTGQLIS